MLTEAQNQTLTQVGAGTPMGELLRRHWQPIGAVTELDERPVKAVRLLGEDLVLYRDRAGTYGLIERRCAHRRADLSYGYVEECGLRCTYHGWAYNEKGQCIEQPFEEKARPGSRFKDKIRLTAYPVEAKAGLVWAYLGPEPAPLVPTWEPFTWGHGFTQIVFAHVPCNWLQCQENSIDPVHFEWLHENWSRALSGGTGPRPPTHLKVRFDEFEYGFTYGRVREGADENDPLWTVGRVCLWPNALFTGDHLEWRVPVDDENTFSVTWAFNRVPKEREPYVQGPIPYWYGPIVHPGNGAWITDGVMNQDFVSWVGQGTIADRRGEHLGASDEGIIMLRRRYLDEMKLLAEGGEPKGVVYDQKRNRCIELPIIARDALTTGIDLERLTARRLASETGFFPSDYPFQVGQPEEIRRAFREAMGIEPKS